MQADLALANSRIVWQVDDMPIDLADPRLLLHVVPTEDLARFLHPLTWAQRAAWCDRVVAHTLDWAAHDIKSMKLRVVDARNLVMCVADDIHAKLADVLDRLEQLGPVPLDEAAWRLYRVAGDPGRLEMARQHWRTRGAEDASMAASVGLALLRDCLIAVAVVDRERWATPSKRGAR